MCCPGPAGAVDLHQACAHRRRHGRDGASTRTGAAVVLAVVVAAGRRPDDSADEDLRGVTRRAYGVVHRLPHDDESDDAPGRPHKGQAGALAALLGTAGLALAAWEAHWLLRLGWDV